MQPTIADILDQVKNILGYPIIELETTDAMIQENLRRAFIKAKPKFYMTEFIWLPYNADTNVIDLSTYSPAITSVIHVYETPISKYAIVDPDVFYMRNFYNMMAMARLFMARTEIDKLVSRDFMYVNQKLFLNEYWGRNMTIEVVLDYPDVTWISDSFFVDWVIRYTIALTKETLGRIRGKYTIRNSPYELDAGRLLIESKEEKEMLMAEVDDMGLFYVTR